MLTHVGIGIVLILLFLGIMYLVLSSSEQFSHELGVTGTDSDDRLENYILERERASAYAFLRDHLDQRSAEPAISAVYCRDSSHRWIGERIELKGDVDFELPSGRLHRHNYRALLSGDSQLGWTLESIRVEPARLQPTSL